MPPGLIERACEPGTHLRMSTVCLVWSIHSAALDTNDIFGITYSGVLNFAVSRLPIFFYNPNYFIINAAQPIIPKSAAVDGG